MNKIAKITDISAVRRGNKQYFRVLLAAGAYIVSFLLVVIGIVSVFVFRQIEEQLFSERASHLNNITDKSATIVDNYITDGQKLAAAAAGAFYFGGGENLSDTLAVAAESADEGVLTIAITDGGAGYFADGSLLEGGVPTGDGNVQICTVYGDKKVLFLSPLEGDKVVGDVTFTRIALAMDAASLAAGLDVADYNGNYLLTITDGDGQILFSCGDAKTLSGDNILLSMRQVKYLHGSSYEQFLSMCEGGKATSIEYKNSYGENDFVSVTPLSSGELYLSMFVPTDVIDGNMSELLGTVISYFIVVAIFFVVLIAFIVLLTVTSRGDRNLIRQQVASNEVLEEAVRRAEEASRAKSDFLSRMSHDIRTPINGIVGMTDIAAANCDNPQKVKDCLQKISYSSDHLLSLINDVLDMSKVESGSITITERPMRLKQVADECAVITVSQIAGRSVDFTANFDELKGCVLGDRLHLKQILINILGNAVKFTPDGGSITFTINELVRSPDSAVYEFIVEDTGIGMSREFLGKIFEPFSQEAGGSRTEYSGTGLGMAITKKLCDLMGGSIEVESELNKGSKFTIKLAFGVCPEHNCATCTKATCDGGNCDRCHIRGMKVLLAEDNSLNAEIAATMLRAEGVKVTCADDGKQAYDLFTSAPKGSFDVILMDIMMPVMDGLQATRAIRASGEEGANIPIIAMTANAYDEDVQKALDAGMNEHLSKPINARQLTDTIAAYKRH